MIQMLRLINPPGHARRKPFPRYAGGGRPRANAGVAQLRCSHCGKAHTRPDRHCTNCGYLMPKATSRLPLVDSYQRKPKTNPKSRSKSMPKKRRTPPRYKSGPKKGQFMPKAARRRKARRNPPKVTHVSVTGKKRKLVLSRLSKKGKALYAKKYKGKTVPVSAVPGIIDEINRHKRRSKTVAKKAKKAKKSKKAARRGKRSHASYVKAGKKAARTRKARKAARKAAAKKSHRKAKRHVKRHVKHVTRKAPRRRRRTRMPRTLMLPAKGRKRRAYRLHRAKKTKRGYRRYAIKRVSRNPGNAMVGMLKDGAMLFGGILGMRVLAGVIKKYVVDKYLGTNASLAKVLPVIPSAATFVLAAFAPKLKLSPKMTQLVQQGAGYALVEAVFNTLIKPSLPATVQGLLAGVDDYGYHGYGEYVPAARQLGGYGVDVQEAMALDEYIPSASGGMGFDVSEALAESEVQGFQAGYAGGSLAKTVFHT